ncbi:hypothetical protein GCM10029978_067840 [Actinoallomurus acanthiterrae]
MPTPPTAPTVDMPLLLEETLRHVISSYTFRATLMERANAAGFWGEIDVADFLELTYTSNYDRGIELGIELNGKRTSVRIVIGAAAG